MKDISPDQGASLLAKAKTFEGKPYFNNAGPASNPKVGFDCSGLVWYVLAKTAGYNFEYRNTATLVHHPMLRRVQVPPSVLQAGDLVLFHSHVGFYDPSPTSRDNKPTLKTLYSATSHGVRNEFPRFWGAPLAYLRLQVVGQ